MTKGASPPPDSTDCLNKAAGRLREAAEKLAEAKVQLPEANRPEAGLLKHEVEDVYIRVKALADLMVVAG